MHRKFDTALRTLQQGLPEILSDEAIAAAAREAGHRWRDCRLTPPAIVHWFLQQILRRNTATQHIALLSGRSFSDSAYCQARSRLPLAVLRSILRKVIEAPGLRTRTDGLWRGHRTMLVDGSSFSMPDTPALQAHFGQPGGQAGGCGFPVAKFVALFDAETGLLSEVAAAPLRTHDMAQIARIHPALRPGDVLVGDRGFCSYAHLAMLTNLGLFAVLRVHQKQIVDFTPGRPQATPGDHGRPHSRWLRSLGVLDQLVEWTKPKSRPAWMAPAAFAALPESLTVRELRYRVRRRGFRTKEIMLVTTLVDAEAYPATELAELYKIRWRVEQDLRDLKQTLNMDMLKCKTVDGVMKELHAFAIVYNLVRSVMMEAASRQGVPVRRISFVDAMRWLGATELHTELTRLAVNPERRDRAEPRVRKRRPKQFPLMTKPRAQWKKDMLAQELAA
jgi:hypothetical protein